jgi:hypothetical protein
MIPGPDELSASVTDGTKSFRAGKYTFDRGGNVAHLDQHPEAAWFRKQVGGFKPDVRCGDGYYNSPIVRRTMLAAIIDTLKAIRSNPFAADAKGDPYLADVIEMRRKDEIRYQQFGGERLTDSDAIAEPALIVLNPTPFFILFLDQVLQKCKERGMDATFAHYVDM